MILMLFLMFSISLLKAVRIRKRVETTYMGTE